MEKKLYLLRHAKSSWQNPDWTDYERPLNERGKHDAPLMGKILRQKLIFPDLILCSSAQRTQETVLGLSSQMSLGKIVFVEALYHATWEKILEIIKAQDSQTGQLMVVGHNPDLTELANYLGGQNIENIPTAGVVALAFSIKNWQELSPQNARFLFFDFPKNYYPKTNLD